MVTRITGLESTCIAQHFPRPKCNFLSPAFPRNFFHLATLTQSQFYLSTNETALGNSEFLNIVKMDDLSKSSAVKDVHDVPDCQEGVAVDNADNLKRQLDNRQIQLIAIGGGIGTALFVSIGTGLYHGGPGSLLIAYFCQCMFLAMVNNCLAEMTTEYPVSGGFIRLAGKWVDEALSFMVGWNFLFVPQSARNGGTLTSAA